MDRWFAWIERQRVYGAFLRDCRWASRPFEWAGASCAMVLPRLGWVALLWGLLPMLVLGVPLAMVLTGYGIAPDQIAVALCFEALLVMMLFSPIVARAALMGLAWSPAVCAAAFGRRGPADRVRAEARSRVEQWVGLNG